MLLIDLRHNYVIRAVSQGRGCFLCVSGVRCLDDLHMNFQVLGKVNPVLIPYYFIQPECV